MKYISVLQGQVILAIEAGHKTVVDISDNTNLTRGQVGSLLAQAMSNGLVLSGGAPKGFTKLYSLTKLEYFAGESVTQNASDIIEAVNLGHVRTLAIIEHTGLTRGQISPALNHLIKIGLIESSGKQKAGFDYRTTGQPYWVKDHATANNGKINQAGFNWAACNWLCFEMEVSA